MTFRLGDVATLPLPLATERRIRGRSCEQKLQHPTEEAAEKHRDHLYETRRAKPGTLEVYRCRFGGHYHVGHRR